MSIERLQPVEEGGATLPSPEAFVEGLRAGDAGVVARLRRHVERRARRRFAAWAWAMIAEDFLSELTWQLTSTVRRPGFRLEVSAAAYVDRAIANRCTSYYRAVARMRRQADVDALEDRVPSDDSNALQRLVAATELRRGLAAVSAQCRRLLKLRFIEERSYRDIAAALGVSRESTVAQRLHACRQRFRGALSRAAR